MRLALLALWLVPSAALAQTDLGGGWSAVTLTAPNDQPTSAACTRTHAYFRGYTGFVARFDGTTVEPLPRIDPSEGSLSGPGLDVTEAGDVLLTGWGHVALLTDGRWTIVELTGRRDWMRSTPLLVDRARALVPGDGALLGIRLPGGELTAYDAGTWRRLAAIEGTERELWAVGEGGVAMHWVSGRLTATRVRAEPAPDLDGIAVVASADVWAWASGRHARGAAHTGGAYHWDGEAWSDRSIAGHHVQSIVAHGSSALAATDDGHVWRWNGATWDDVLTTGRTLGDGCATDTHAVFLDEGGALVFRRWP